ncbi:MBL fold metallo-hydrolase [Endomicrobiia bacterium]|nr:MBL fold metallo-hydrolase [Endomicrobiia bacterium]GHT12506.1 MBL fold metallo-hydrolase [Endomicrobiia bacterium]GHT20062.1 MBL fold metallo-hydrolase [Endomicrobiia bacterium]GHT27181.1 MBL fold metallo-hydrolase [Endomicrobiia bacterium]GHT29801.1 MBL fold metallo-hydrolase [Endomicrobiia bacterium]
MTVRLIKDGVYAVGAIDWNERHFHGHTYVTRRGVTYNSYLIVDEKITLIDTVRRGYEKELIENIRTLVDLSKIKIDIIIINHIEPDHSGAFPEILKLCPGAKVYGTERARQGLLKYYGVSGDWTVVKSGQSLNIGKRTLNFIDVPMIHWPDSMFTYSAYDKILFSNDGFGQHYATNKVFDDEVDFAALMDEAQKYYANILWPFNALVAAKLSTIDKLNLNIELIAPSHGLVWRRYVPEIMQKYLYWSSHSCQNRIAVVYETMWNSTEKMAGKIIEGITSEGVEAVLFDVTKNDRTDIASYMLDAKGWVFGSSTHDGEMLPVITGFLHFLKGSKAKGRRSFAFGSYGWSGEAVKDIEDTGSCVSTFESSLMVVFNPTDEELNKCFEAGKTFALKIKTEK